MSANTCTNTWDEVWAEFDKRQAARSGNVDPERMVEGAAGTHAGTTRLRQLIHARRSNTLPARRSLPDASADRRRGEAERLRAAQGHQRENPRGLGRFKRGLAVIACTVIAVYAGSPVASAVQVAAAIHRGDTAALAHYIDWTTLRPALNAALAAEARRNDSQPCPDFIAGMAQDMAERLSSPGGLALLLNERLAAGGPQPARDMLSRIRMVEAGLWEVTLTSVNVPDRSAKLTLALTDAMRLRWEVQAIELPAQLPARFR